eukprot:CAMPEP_0197467516 /NCGR_PEP_ID=MMETSP1175-20131217/65607_1 /TAXON_ID=1003142 /ORGANISM="Triceratium dubium, Strain CCMP147" /LENGTH=493 /DNA_ID=CAMNT_0043003591 /DNA_START=20 /DNA_END=1504 /DNA_ORIENTATION=-
MNPEFKGECDCPEGIDEPPLDPLPPPPGPSPKEGPEGTCDLDGIDKKCHSNEGSEYELCFDASADGTSCRAHVVDTANDNYTYCCDGCAVCPRGCKYGNAFDCTNLNAEFTGVCECPEGIEEPSLNGYTPAPPPPSSTTPGVCECPVSVLCPCPLALHLLAVFCRCCFVKGTAHDGRLSSWISPTLMSLVQFPLDAGDALIETQTCFRALVLPVGTLSPYPSSSSVDVLCSSTAILQILSLNRDPPLNDGEGGHRGTFTERVHARPAASEFHHPSTVLLPPTVSSTTLATSTPASSPTGISSECLLDETFNSNASCDPVPDTTLEACVDLNVDSAECSFWVRDATTGTDLCCQGCTVCPPGCGTFGFDCENWVENVTAPCVCPNEASTSLPPTMPPTPTAPVPTSPTAPVAAPTSPSTPQPALLDLSTFATNSECMVDGGQDALCLPIENSTLAVCLDRNSANMSASGGTLITYWENITAVRAVSFVPKDAQT